MQEPAPAGITEDGRIRPERLKLFRTRLANLFATTLQDGEQFMFTDLLELINQGLPTEQLFGTAEATIACEVMGEAEELMLSGGVVYKI